MPHAGKIVGTGKSCRTATDDSNALARGWSLLRLVVCLHVLCREALEAADVHRIVHHAAATVHLAGMLADKAADDRKRIVLPDELHGIRVASCLDERDVARDIDSCRAARDAGDKLRLLEAAGVVLDMVLEIVAEAPDRCQRHASRFISDCAVAREIDCTRRLLDELERLPICLAFEDLVHELLQDAQAYTAGRAFSAALRCAHANEGSREFDRTWSKRAHREPLLYRFMQSIHDCLGLAALDHMQSSHSISSPRAFRTAEARSAAPSPEDGFPHRSLCHEPARRHFPSPACHA